MPRIAKLFIIGTWVAANSVFAGVDPTQAQGKILELLTKKAGKNSVATSFEIGIGKFDLHKFADYGVKAVFILEDGSKAVECSGSLTVEKVSFAKQPANVTILEQIVNDYQIIAKGETGCKSLN